MLLLNPWFLAGLALMLVPVLLHLLLRSKPKQLIFPALRLIQIRRLKNVQRMRLRHLWLLLLRMLVIGLVALALARPSVPAANYGLNLGDVLRLVAVLVVVAGTWFALTTWWRQQKLANNELAYRRTWAGWGVGVTGLVLFLLLFAWPYGSRIAASITAPTIAADESIPVTAALVFDTSLSMEYQFEGLSRLDVAKAFAQEHMRGLPSGSRLAVGDTSSDAPFRFQSDLNQQQTRLGALVIQPVSRLLSDRLEAALEAHLADRERKSSSGGALGPETSLREVYLFTDLSASAWMRTETPRLTQLLKELAEVNLYLIDVGVESPKNTGLVDVSLSDQTLPQGGELQVRALLRGTGVNEEDRTVDLLVADDAGRMVKQGQANVRLQVGSDVPVQFTLRELAGPIRQGEVRIVGSDPFVADDVRFFSVRVQTPPQILVVAENLASAQFLTEALAPAELVKLGRARYQCVFATSGQLGARRLSDYRVVCLVNVSDPGAGEWSRLTEFARNGGGVLIALGPRVQHAAYLSPAARDLLPGELKAALTFRPGEFLDLQDLTHPVLKKFEDWGTAELANVEILKYWSVAPTADATVIARFTDLRKSPALLDRIIGEGRVLLITTAIDRGGWNDLPTSGWSFIALSDQILRYLSRAGDTSWNPPIGRDLRYPLNVGAEGAAPQVAGEAGAAQPPGHDRPQQVLLRKPGMQQVRLDIPAEGKELVLQGLDQVGNYRVLGVEADSKFEIGFSLNGDPAESDFRRLQDEDLKKMLGENRYSVARTIEGLKREVRAGRVGREIFPWLLTVLIVVFVTEHVVANRFYDPVQQAAVA